MRRSRLVALMLATAATFAFVTFSWAASDTQTLTINAQVNARAKLTISPTVINFADADPDVTPSIPATENSVSVGTKVRTTAGGAVTLTCLANGDLLSGTDSIGIDNVTWTSTGAGFVGGTMNSTTAQSVGSWTGSGNRSGTMDFFLANSWAYAIGSYTQTVDYTLSAP